MSAERIQRMMAVNVTGSILCAREAVKRMSTRKGGEGGVIVNLSSVAAKLGAPNTYVDYAASKGAVDSFTVGLGHEVAGEGIRVAAIRPGLIDTEIHASGGEPDRAHRLAHMVPMQRVGTADEIANAIVWLISDEASYVINGTGKILGAGKVEVSGGDGKAQTVETKNIVIATGSDIARLKGIEIDEKRVVSSTGALSLEKVPERMLIIGAGVIGLELGSVWKRLGAEVMVVEFLDRILPGMDGEVAKQFQRMLEKQGFAFKLGAKVTGVDTSGKMLKASVEPAAGGTAETLETDVVLVCIGRVPYTDGLGCKEAGIALDNRGRVQIDAHFATTVRG